ncbi:MAG: response regulator [Syntrophobacteraceae bacterium]|nr:response regulator [Syntrophobacteraceae bacterium]
MNNRRIMVVDDEVSICEMMKRAFTGSGFEVETAGSAEKAIELIKSYKYLVFFLDLNLPGMNGIELCRSIRKDNPLTITYAVTGYARIFEAFDCRDAGFEDYFTKPVAIKTLLQAAENAFQKLERWGT